MTFFLGGLPKEFKPTVDALIAGGVHDQGIVLSRLQEIASRKTPSKEVGKSVSNVKQLTCWNCREVGHRKIDYPELEKGSDNKKSGKKKSKSHDNSDKKKFKGKKLDYKSGHGKQKGKKKSYYGSAKKADKSNDLSNKSESESRLDKTINWVGFIQYGDNKLPDAED